MYSETLKVFFVSQWLLGMAQFICMPHPKVKGEITDYDISSIAITYYKYFELDLRPRSKSYWFYVSTFLLFFLGGVGSIFLILKLICSMLCFLQCVLFQRWMRASKEKSEGGFVVQWEKNTNRGARQVLLAHAFLKKTITEAKKVLSGGRTGKQLCCSAIFCYTQNC